MRDRELIHIQEQEGFTLSTYRLPEYDSPVGHFASGNADLDAEIIADIESGALDWFAVEVTASKAGVELGSDHLGACCYESPAAFIDGGDYHLDMCTEAIRQARAKLASLCARLQTFRFIRKRDGAARLITAASFTDAVNTLAAEPTDPDGPYSYDCEVTQ